MVSAAPRGGEAEVASRSGGGDPLATLARGRDWAATVLGPIDDWPDALRHAAMLALAAPEPAIVWWGVDLAQIYNVAARPLYGPLYPTALGRMARYASPAGWDVLQPLLAGALADGEAAGFEDQPFSVEGPGGPEERHFSGSIIPIRTGRGEVGGLLGMLRDTTARAVAERQLRLLCDLGDALIGADSIDAVCRGAAHALAGFPRDIPFAFLYLLDRDGLCGRLAGQTPRGRGTPIAPGEIALAAGPAHPVPWHLAWVATTGRAEFMGDVQGCFAAPTNGALAVQSPAALLLPLIPSGAAKPLGILVAGVPQQRAGDEGHPAFMGRVAGRIADAIIAGGRFEEERRRATELAALGEAKTAFFADLSQEFVAPLSLMLGPIQVLQAGAGAVDTPHGREMLALVQRGCLRLLKLVNTFHQFARLETGSIAANREETDLAQFTADLASMFRPAVEAAGLRLIVDCPALPRLLQVDRGMWEKIVLNLLSNAVKYTHRGEVAVTLRLAEATDGERVVLAIRDTGVGIAPRDVDRLLDRYQRVRGSGGRTREGFGIGLSLVRELTRLHGGTVAVESTVGRGSAFIVTIPVPAPQPRTGRAAAPSRANPQAPTPYVGEVLRWLPDAQASGGTCRAPHDAPDASHERVLVVAEHADLRAYLRRLLEARWAIEVAANREEAIATSRTAPPALVLAEIVTPEAEGMALVRALRDNPGTAAVPIILLSGRADAEGTVGGLEAGADDVLPLPCPAQELCARVQSHIHLARLRREAQALREEFIAAAAHDLRTPLTSIQIGLGLLEVEMMGLSPDARGVLDVVRRNAQRLAIHVGDLVTANQLSADLLQVQDGPLDLCDVAREAVAAVQLLFSEKGQRVAFALPRPLPILGDARRLEQVLVNLLANAHRHTPTGARVTITGRVAGADIHLTVSDTGPGIPDGELERIFERYRRLQPGHGGSGLGLSIARNLIELHGGRIWAESPPGRGAQFHILLPRGRGSDNTSENTPNTFKGGAREEGCAS